MATEEQTEIPGTERPTIAAIQEAADFYEEKRDARMEATTEEVDSKAALQKVLHEHEDELTDRDEDGNPGYVYTDGNGKQKIAILVRSEEDVKVKKYKLPKVGKDKADA